MTLDLIGLALVMVKGASLVEIGMGMPVLLPSTMTRSSTSPDNTPQPMTTAMHNTMADKGHQAMPSQDGREHLPQR